MGASQEIQTIMDIHLVLTCLLVVTTTHALRVGPRNTDPRMLMKPASEMLSQDAMVNEVKNEGGKQVDANFLRLVDMINKMDSEFVNEQSRDGDIVTPKPIPKSTTTAPQSMLRGLCQTPRGMFPHPLDCRKYVDCWDGRVLEKFCPNDLVFSDLPGTTGGFCDYLEYVDCGTRPVLNNPYP